jgi:hypothetical protein
MYKFLLGLVVGILLFSSSLGWAVPVTTENPPLNATMILGHPDGQRIKATLQQILASANSTTLTEEQVQDYFGSLIEDPDSSFNNVSFSYLDSLDALEVNASGGSGEVSISGTPTAGQLAEWVNATTLQGVSSINATITGEPIQREWAINANSTGSVLADTYPALSWQQNATVEELRVYSESSVSLTTSFYYSNGTKVGDVSLSAATSGTNDITDVSVNEGDRWYLVTGADVSTEWLTAIADGVTR